jgi:nucleotidyltransferase substrate binding protein (TIGR01987 family)
LGEFSLVDHQEFGNLHQELHSLMKDDVRWKQRFENYGKALHQLESAISAYGQDDRELIRAGIIQFFEFTHELAWKVMKDFLEFEGLAGIVGARSATREAFQKGLIEDGQAWMDMLETRNITVHAYDPLIITEAFLQIVNINAGLLRKFHQTMNAYL